MYNSGLYVYFESGGIKTADNGLTATGTNVQLGGALLQNTVIDIEGFTLAANMSGAGKDLQVWDGVNRINTFYQTVRFDPADFGLNANDLIGFNATGDAYQLTASNGLTVTPASPGTNRLKLGGTLLEDTVINGSNRTYKFSISNPTLFEVNRNAVAGETNLTGVRFNLSAVGNGINRFELLHSTGGGGSSGIQLYINYNVTGSQASFTGYHGTGFFIGAKAPGTTGRFQLGAFGNSANLVLHTSDLTASAGYRVMGSIVASVAEVSRLDRAALTFGTGVNLTSGTNSQYTGTGTIYARMTGRGSWFFTNKGVAANPPAYADSYEMYSADIIGGDACPHFLTEDNKTIILYPFNTYGAPTGTATRTTFDTATVTLPDLAERVKALIDDLQQNGIIG